MSLLALKNQGGDGQNAELTDSKWPSTKPMDDFTEATSTYFIVFGFPDRFLLEKEEILIISL